MHILITGGAGYIGSHTALELLNSGHDVTVVDNLCNSKEEALRRVRSLTGKPLAFHRADVLDAAALDRVFASRPVDAVIHFAALKAVGESVLKPLDYYSNNLTGAISLLYAMRRHGVKTLVFSSSATVYGAPASVPIHEDAPTGGITNPYGWTKLMTEQIMSDLQSAEPDWRIARLRYFNPVGAHASGRIGEDPHGTPTNIFPLISQVAVGRRPRLEVFGSDWPTSDGTGVRDYIHVMDLAEGHGAALGLLLAEPPQLLTLNLGSGQGHSVLELVTSFAAASGQPIPIQFSARRPGDSAISIADATAAKRRMDWSTHRGLAEICRDGWAWQQANPQGYGT